MSRISGWSIAALDLFNSWFTSDAGVWHTAVITLGIVGVEIGFPNLDPHGFWLLYWLTVYSALTQPALARAGRVAGEQQEKALAKIEALEQQVATLIGQLALKEDQEIALLEARGGREDCGS